MRASLAQLSGQQRMSMAGEDCKFDLDLVEATTDCSPFTVNYSCEATTRALALLAQTVSWTEKLDG